MRRLAWIFVLVLVAGLAVAFLRDDGGKAPMLAGTPKVPQSVAVDTPELRELKAAAGIADCAPGPGGGSLPSVTVACLGGGTPVDLSTLRGPLVINVWQSACVACEDEMPILQAFHQDHAGRVGVLGIDSADQYPGDAFALLDATGVTYPQLADPDGDLQETSVFAKIRAYPHLLFLDAAGEVAYEKAGPVESADELRELVETHLGVDL